MSDPEPAPIGAKMRNLPDPLAVAAQEIIGRAGGQGDPSQLAALLGLVADRFVGGPGGSAGILQLLGGLLGLGTAPGPAAPPTPALPAGAAGLLAALLGGGAGGLPALPAPPTMRPVLVVQLPEKGEISLYATRPLLPEEAPLLENLLKAALPLIGGGGDAKRGAGGGR